MRDSIDGIDYTDKSTFRWILVISLPDFVTRADFEGAVQTAEKKKKMNCSSAEFLKENGYENDINDKRLHHEIYMSDARKTAPERLKTVIRHSIKKV